MSNFVATISLLPLADGGTPLLWATFLQLTIGNLLIGILEAAIVRRVFKVGGRALFGWLIAGNYVSCIVGMFLLSEGSDRITSWAGGPLPIYHFYRIVVCLAAASFLVTIIVEWPFYWLALRKQARGWMRSVNATLLANATSYVFLIAWYVMASRMTIVGVTLVQPKGLPLNRTARVLYISPDGADVFQLRLDGSSPTKLISLKKPSPNGALGFTTSGINGQWRLEIRPDYDQPVEFVTNVGPCRATTRDTKEDNWIYSFEADDLQDTSPRKWSASIGFWAVQGIRASNNLTGQSQFIMSVEAPWLEWSVRSATILPYDQLVFQLGEQIMWVDLAHNTAAAIAAGHGPVVVLDEEHPATSTEP